LGGSWVPIWAEACLHDGSRLRHRPQCIRRGPSFPVQKGHGTLSFRPMSIVAKRSPISATAELLFSSLNLFQKQYKQSGITSVFFRLHLFRPQKTCAVHTHVLPFWWLKVIITVLWFFCKFPYIVITNLLTAYIVNIRPILRYYL